MSLLVKKYWTVLRVGLIVGWVRLLLRFNSLPLVLERLSLRSRAGRSDDATMRKLIYYVDRWLQLFPYNERGNCFPRALALYRLARQLGYPVRFHCGVRKEASNLDGHAWLTLDSEAFYEPGKQWRCFAITFSYPSDSVSGVSRVSASHGPQLRTMKS